MYTRTNFGGVLPPRDAQPSIGSSGRLSLRTMLALAGTSSAGAAIVLLSLMTGIVLLLVFMALVPLGLGWFWYTTRIGPLRDATLDSGLHAR